MSVPIICLVYDGQFHSVPTPLGYGYNEQTDETCISAIVAPFYGTSHADRFKKLLATIKLRLKPQINQFDIIKEACAQMGLYYLESPTVQQIRLIDEAIDRCKKGLPFTVVQ